MLFIRTKFSKALNIALSLLEVSGIIKLNIEAQVMFFKVFRNYNNLI